MKKFYLFLALFLAALNLRPIITSVAPLLETMQNVLGMSGLTASLLTTLPVLCMGVFAPAAAVLRDRIGLERTIVMALLLITGATAWRGLDGSVPSLVASALIGGLGISLTGPLLSGYIKKYFPKSPGVVSIYSAAMVAGAAAASAFSIPIYEQSRHSLTLALSCWAILGVLALAVWSAFLPVRASRESTVRSKLPIRNAKAWLLTLFFAMMASMFYSVTAWISPMAHSFGYSPASSALLLTVFTLVQIPVSLTVPALAARSGSLRLALIGCSLFELAGIVLLLLHLPMLPAVVCLGIGAGGLFPLALMLPIVETNTSEEAGSWSAMSQCGGYVIGAAGPLLVGALRDYSGGFEGALLAMLVMVAAMMAIQMLLTARKAGHKPARALSAK